MIKLPTAFGREGLCVKGFMVNLISVCVCIHLCTHGGIEDDDLHRLLLLQLFTSPQKAISHKTII